MLVSLGHLGLQVHLALPDRLVPQGQLDLVVMLDQMVILDRQAMLDLLDQLVQQDNGVTLAQQETPDNQEALVQLGQVDPEVILDKEEILVQLATQGHREVKVRKVYRDLRERQETLVPLELLEYLVQLVLLEQRVPPEEVTI